MTDKAHGKNNIRKKAIKESDAYAYDLDVPKEMVKRIDAIVSQSGLPWTAAADIVVQKGLSLVEKAASKKN